ncbi:MAG: hypothetical protein ACE5JL_04670, partial [Dehalococcoidia bacterium]
TCCPTWNGGGEMVRSGPDAVALALSRHLKGDGSVSSVAAQGLASQPSLFEQAQANVNGKEHYAGRCPECNCRLTFQEGCFLCPGCGYNKCG